MEAIKIIDFLRFFMTFYTFCPLCKDTQMSETYSEAPNLELPDSFPGHNKLQSIQMQMQRNKMNETRIVI
jgi:hypothetical protein